jgi:hypothetical protein
MCDTLLWIPSLLLKYIPPEEFLHPMEEFLQIAPMMEGFLHDGGIPPLDGGIPLGH